MRAKPFELTPPTPADVLAQVAAREAEARERNAGAKPEQPQRPATTEQTDLFEFQGALF